ncbi:hypothetical protein GCM10025734_76810 [Kitasatospora paranensis]
MAADEEFDPAAGSLGAQVVVLGGAPPLDPLLGVLTARPHPLQADVPWRVDVGREVIEGHELRAGGVDPFDDHHGAGRDLLPGAEFPGGPVVELAAGRPALPQREQDLGAEAFPVEGAVVALLRVELLPLLIGHRTVEVVDVDDHGAVELSGHRGRQRRLARSAGAVDREQPSGPGGVGLAQEACDHVLRLLGHGLVVPIGRPFGGPRGARQHDLLRHLGLRGLREAAGAPVLHMVGHGYSSGAVCRAEPTEEPTYGPRSPGGHPLSGHRAAAPSRRLPSPGGVLLSGAGA